MINLKIQSMAHDAKAKIIRQQEVRAIKKLRKNIQKYKEAGHESEYRYWEDKNYRYFADISFYRKGTLRNVARATFLARAYLQGIPYSIIEKKRKDDHVFIRDVLPHVMDTIRDYDIKNRVYDKDNKRYVLVREEKKRVLEWCGLPYEEDKEKVEKPKMFQWLQLTYLLRR